MTGPDDIAVMKLRIIPTAEGYFYAVMNQYIYNYTDHLGNVRLSYSDTNKDGVIQSRQYLVRECSGFGWNQMCIDIWRPGEIVEANNYYPFGLLHNYTATTQNAYQYKYNGKELQESGNLDYGWRQYMPDIGRWGVVDAMTEASRRFSPYVYGNNNPIRFIDPDGNFSVSFNGAEAQQAFSAYKASMSMSSEHIEPGSQGEWNKHKKAVQLRHSSVLAFNLMNNGAFSNELQSLNKTLKTIDMLEKSSQTYQLKPGAIEEGGTIYDVNTGYIIFSFADTPNFVHEITHGGSFESGEMAFNKSNGNLVAQDIYDEVSAYKAQYNYDSKSVSSLKSIFSVKSLNNITPTWVQGITKTDGSKPYSAGGSANSAIIPLNINSSRDTLIKAFPSAVNVLKTLPITFVLKDDPNIYYKK